jgi:hypothetical protein
VDRHGQSDSYSEEEVSDSTSDERELDKLPNDKAADKEKRKRDTSPFLGCPPVLEMNVWPLMRQQGADSQLQLSVLNHRRGTATHIKWFVYLSGTF